MSRFPIPSCRILATAVFLAVLAAATSARASCGDYLHAAGEIVTDTALPVELPRQTDRRVVPPVPAHRPCHGPGCRNAPHAPPLDMAPPSATSRVDRHLSAARCGEPPRGAALRPAFAFPRAADAAAGHPRRVDRPPRLAA